MKIAIHNRNSIFTNGWIDYCNLNKINYKIVNCYDNDIIKQLNDCDALMWHHHHMDVKDVILAKQLLFALEQSGMKVFPNFKTSWHFDDKLGQKYLFESHKIPCINTSIFYDKKSALDWAKHTDYPKVFKLRRGSGARNVSLVNSEKEAISKINKAFGKGFSLFSHYEYFKDRLSKYRNGKDSLIGALKGAARLIIPTKYSKSFPNEKDYIYFQDFLSKNEFDIRVIVIGNKAYGMKRYVRKNDFRASGSNDFDYNDIDVNVISEAFKASEKLGFQCMAYDFVYDNDGLPKIIESSYVYGTKGSSNCPGYWDRELNWYEGKFNPFGWMIEDLINDINKS